MVKIPFKKNDIVLVNLTYYSSIEKQSFDSNDLAKILRVSRVNNEKNGISGALFFSQKYFFQCLEGERSAVNETFSRICKSPDHDDVVVVECREITHRKFASWAMASLANAEETVAVFKNQGISDINPEQLTQQDFNHIFDNIAAEAELR